MADSSVFNELPSIKNFTDKVNSKIEVEGQQYNFEDMIENEYISDFPKYSHRMRSNFVEIVRYTDLFFNKTRDGLLRIENNVNATIQNALATDTKNGLISYDKVKELATNKINELLPESKITELSFNKMKEFGLGLTTTSTGHINDYRPNGFYVFGWQGGGIGNKTTGVFNIQYADRYGVQLAITQEDKTRAFIRAKNNGSWTSHKELMQVDDFNLYANAYLGNSEVKTLNGRNAVKVAENDILVYDTNNKKYYYKSKINGNITIPTEENTEKIMLGSGMGFVELKRKLMIGGVEEVS